MSDGATSIVSAADFALRLAFGLLFLTLGLSKLSNRSGFQAAVRAYRLVPTQWVRFISLGLVGGEVMVGLLLLFGLFTATAAIAGVVLLLAFGVAIAVDLQRGLEINCGCNPRRQEPISGSLVVRNVALSAALGLLVVLPNHKWSSEVALSLTEGHGTASGAIGACSVVVAAVIGLGAVRAIRTASHFASKPSTAGGP